jgi:hypothetical protein
VAAASKFRQARRPLIEQAPPPPPERARRHWFWRIAPYLIAGFAVAAILYRYPPATVAAEMRQGNALATFPFALAMVYLSLLINARADAWVIGRTARPVTYGQVFRGKAGATVLMLIGYAAGHGGYGVWIARVTGSNAKTAASVILYIMASELLVVSALCTGAVWLGAADVPAALRVVAPAIAGVLLFFKLTGPLRWLGDRAPVLLQPWSKMGHALGLGQLALRAAQIGLMAVLTWGAARAFGLHVPFAVMMGHLPVILVVASLPVNVAGFGAVQGAWLLLSPWASSGAQVLAFSVLWQLGVGIGMLIRGLPFVPRVLREIARPG